MKHSVIFKLKLSNGYYLKSKTKDIKEIFILIDDV